MTTPRSARALAAVGGLALACACGRMPSEDGPSAANAAAPPAAPSVASPPPASSSDSAPAAPTPSLPGAPTCAAPSDVPPRLVLAARGDVVTLDLATLAAVGTLPGSYQSVTAGCGLYALDYDAGVVAKLDEREPWKRVASYDAGRAVEHFATTSTKGYAVAGGSTTVAVFDTTKTTEHVAPTGWVDLSPMDAPVMATVSVPEKDRVFFLLREGGVLPACEAGHGWVTAIDTTTDIVAPIGGAHAPIVLDGANPTSIAYDASRDRLLVYSSGCIDDKPADGPRLAHDEVEAIDLATGARETVTSFDGPWGAPQPFVIFGDPTHALVLRDQQHCVYDPSSGTLGACASMIAADHPNIEQLFWDAHGARFLAVADAIQPPTSGRGAPRVLSRSLVAVDASTGAPTVLAAPAPFSSTPAAPDEPLNLITSAAIWPGR